MIKKVAVLSFSARPQGNCSQISRFIQESVSDTSIRCFTIDPADFAPCGSCNYECLSPGQICPNRTEQGIRIMDTVCHSELIYCIIPNYCGRPCANYYSYQERIIGYFNPDRTRMAQYTAIPKRFIVVSNTEGFEDALRQQPGHAPEVLYLKTSRYQKQSTAGDLMTSDAARTDLKAFLDTAPL